MQIMLKIENAVPRLPEKMFASPVNWTVKKGENWAVIGPNGAGKTLLIEILAGKTALKSGGVACTSGKPLSDAVKCVSFNDIYSLAGLQNSYYQQRWNAGDRQDAPLVGELLRKAAGTFAGMDFLNHTFAIEDLLDKPVNLLSSGELRKFLIVRSLAGKPELLILDNPYIGLDEKSRGILNELFIRMTSLEGLQIVLVLSNVSDIPETVTHVLPVKDKTTGEVVTRKDFMQDTALQNSLFPAPENLDWNVLKEEEKATVDFDNTLVFKDIRVCFDGRNILNSISWRVKRGEKWALLGENGAGKTTLLSLAVADNPQAYANDIILFDRKRGSGESIWDIKKHIGYISPEMHLYYRKNVSGLDIVGSGFFDTIGLYRQCTDGQKTEALQWMRLFGVEHLKDRPFLNLSSGEQRLVLLVRVFVKRPALLILDEPLHGLDASNKRRVRNIIEKYCTPQKSLIYVTHYEHEIPAVVDKRFRLVKNL
ncbi:MAG: ATP-binding cassette domain-containing protein [Prevotella sp.]|jgi:molybdate transport system ATP-binding protein|nr:ATP-binding cassette domain-containing protein [Prevotella sp.]